MSWRYGAVKVKEVEDKLDHSDITLRQIADVILELRANTEQLEDILTRLKEEDDGGVRGA